MNKYIYGPVALLTEWLPGFDRRNDVRFSLDKENAIVEVKQSDSEAVKTVPDGLEVLTAGEASTKCKTSEFHLIVNGENTADIPPSSRRHRGRNAD